MKMERREKMFGHIMDWENSNLSQLDFCKKNGIAFRTFGYWRKRYLQKETTDTKVKVFKPIKLVFRPESIYKMREINRLRRIFANIYKTKEN